MSLIFIQYNHTHCQLTWGFKEVDLHAIEHKRLSETVGHVAFLLTEDLGNLLEITKKKKK